MSWVNIVCIEKCRSKQNSQRKAGKFAESKFHGLSVFWPLPDGVQRTLVFSKGHMIRLRRGGVGVPSVVHGTDKRETEKNKATSERTAR